MSAGARPHRVTIQSLTRTEDQQGGYTEDWTTTRATRWASIEPATASNIERRVGHQIEAKLTHLVTVQYVAGMLITDRVKFGSRYFQIRDITNHEELNVQLTLACEELIS
jgi:SPP1 family predicted phage head-tail adaptor